MEIEKNNTFELAIERIAFGGKGIGYIGEKICMVPGCLPGEIALVRICKVNKNYVNALPLKIIKASAHRIEPQCLYALTPSKSKKLPAFCPGCSYQHVDYPTELAIKDRQFKDFILRTLDIDADKLQSPLPSPAHNGYRNKLVLHVYKEGNETRIGYFMEDNRSILDIDRCMLVNDAINKKYQQLRGNPGFTHTLRDGMKLTFRYNERSGVLFWRNKAPANASWLRESCCVGNISVPQGSFHQVNSAGCNLLINEVIDKIKMLNPARVFDLYCGSGLFSAAAASCGVKEIIGLDIDDSAINAANYNMKQFDCDSQFFAGRADKLIGKLCRDSKMNNSLMIADPPRSGLEAKTAKAIAESQLKHLIYISCGADTLGRDLKVLLRAGFKYQCGRVIDMFPRTAHFESINYLER